MLLDLLETQLLSVSKSLFSTESIGSGVPWRFVLCFVLDFKGKAKLCSNFPKLSGLERTGGQRQGTKNSWNNCVTSTFLGVTHWFFFFLLQGICLDLRCDHSNKCYLHCSGWGNPLYFLCRVGLPCFVYNWDTPESVHLRTEGVLWQKSVLELVSGMNVCVNGSVKCGEIFVFSLSRTESLLERWAA